MTSAVPLKKPVLAESHVATKDAEWLSRPYTFGGVLGSFVSQLKVGIDLTKVSIPALFFHPYSVLELAAYRNLRQSSLLSKAYDQLDPIERFLGVIKWYLAFSSREDFHKKPYNALLGETHHCASENGSLTYIAEQVSHHPPISAYHMEDTNKRIYVDANVGFGIGFHGNSVSINVNGQVKLMLPCVGSGQDGDFDIFYIDKPIPDAIVSNVVIGTKRFSWTGTVKISCPTSGLNCTITFGERAESAGWFSSTIKNSISGSIVWSSSKDVLFTFDGVSGEKVNLHDCRSDVDSVFVEYPLAESRILYSTLAELDETDSLNLWRDVSRAIISNDMPAADAAKNALEASQRVRRKARAAAKGIHQPKYFTFVPSDPKRSASEYADGDTATSGHGMVRSMETGLWVFSGTAGEKN